MKMESDVVSKIRIQFCAIKFPTLLLEKSEKFSLAKLVDMVKGMSSTGLVCKKNSSQALSDLTKQYTMGYKGNLCAFRSP